MNRATERKKEFAKILFLRTSKSQKEIAEQVDVAEKTISKWKTSENWERLKSSIIITREEQLRRIYQQIAELTRAIEKRAEGERYADCSEADTLAKLAAATRNLETNMSIADIIDAFMGFTDWLREIDLEKARLVTDLEDAYIKHRLNG